jgi:hypothetical protein
MNELFELWDPHPANPQVFPDLATILAALPPDATRLTWQLIDMEMIGTRTTSRDLLALGALTGRGTGVRVSFSDLTRMSTDDVQIVNGIFLAPIDPDSPPAASASNADLLGEANALLAAVDSTFWTLWVPPGWVPSLEAAFGDLRRIEPEDAQLGV